MTATPTERRARLTERVAEEIRAVMGRRRVTGAELARRLQVSQMWVSYRLNGRQPIDVDDLERIAAVLEVPVVDLFPRSALVNQPNGPTAAAGPARADTSGWNLGPAERTGPPAHPDRVRPRDNRPDGHPKFPVLPPTARRPVPRRRAA